MTSKKYRPWNPDQAYLFPPSMRDWLEEEARQAKVEELRERAAIQRRAASTEPDPTERKRKLTRASRSEEKADAMAGKKCDGPDADGTDDPDDDLPSHRVPTIKDGSPTKKAQRKISPILIVES